MSLMKNNNGLASSLLVIVALLFMFGLVTVIVIPIKTEWDSAINNLPEDVASNYTKETIAQHTNQLSWLDKLFVFFLAVLLATYIVTSFTLPVRSAWVFLVFTGFLLVVTFVGMVLSNSWTFMLSDPFFSGVKETIPMTDFVLRNFPYFIFLTGIVGGVIFYSRSKEEFSGDIGGDMPPPPEDFGGGNIE